MVIQFTTTEVLKFMNVLIESKRRVYGREKLEEKQRSDKTTTIRPQTLESNVVLPGIYQADLVMINYFHI